MTRTRSALALLFIGLLSIIIIPYAAAAAPSVYKVIVDDYYGFKIVRIVEPSDTQFTYENLTLRINAGDSVIWENQAYDNSELTIVSEQNLWDSKQGYLRYNYRSFNYTFTQPGTYQVSIREEPRIRHQTIIVAAVETPVVTTPAPTATTAIATASVAPTPQTTSPGINLWYILAILVAAGIVVFIYYFKK